MFSALENSFGLPLPSLKCGEVAGLPSFTTAPQLVLQVRVRSRIARRATRVVVDDAVLNSAEPALTSRADRGRKRSLKIRVVQAVATLSWRVLERVTALSAVRQN